MSETPNILHQEDVEAVVEDVIDNYEVPGDSDFVEKVGGTIADPGVPGAAYVEAEVVALRTAIVAILGKLRTSGLISS